MNNDILYYNVVLNNKSPDKSILKFEETRTGTIIDDPSKYQCAVVRFSIPGTNIPISIFDETDDLFIKLVYGDCESVIKLFYYDNSPSNARKPLYDKAIYSIQGWLDILNISYLLALEQLELICEDFPPIDPETGEPYDIIQPLFMFDPATQLISMFAQSQFYTYYPEDSGIDYIKVCMNLPLYYKFPSFDAFAINDSVNPITGKIDSYNQIMVQPLIGNQIGPYLQMTQEYISLSLLNDFQKIVFESASLPLNNEFVQGEGDVTRSILTDFLIPSETNDRSDIQFNGVGLQLRWIDMISTVPLRSIDITGFWTDKDDNFNPIYLPSYGLFTMKLAFRKKPIYHEQRINHTIRYNLNNDNEQKVIEDTQKKEEQEQEQNQNQV